MINDTAKKIHQEGYTNTSEGNMNAPFPSSSLRHTKELYPHVYETIELLWGYPELQSYLVAPEQLPTN